MTNSASPMPASQYDRPDDMPDEPFSPLWASVTATFASDARSAGPDGDLLLTATLDRAIAYGWTAYLESARLRVMTQGEAFSDDLPPGVLSRVRKIATDHGMAAASWVFDGNTDRAAYERMLTGIEEGDPEVLDSVRVPDLAGEHGDDFTERDLAVYLGIEPVNDAVSDAAATAYEDIARDTFWAEVERVARVQLAPEHADYPHEPGRLHDCEACESSCHCTPGAAECVFEGEHNGSAAPCDDDMDQHPGMIAGFDAESFIPPRDSYPLT